MSPGSPSLLSLWRVKMMMRKNLSPHRWRQKLKERTVEDQNQPGTLIQINKYNQCMKSGWILMSLWLMWDSVLVRNDSVALIVVDDFATGGEKPFSCAVCRKKFPRIETLVRHLRSQSGEKPYSCLFCKKQFTRSDSHEDPHGRNPSAALCVGKVSHITWVWSVTCLFTCRRERTAAVFVTEDSADTHMSRGTNVKLLMRLWSSELKHDTACWTRGRQCQQESTELIVFSESQQLYNYSFCFIWLSQREMSLGILSSLKVPPTVLSDWFHARAAASQHWKQQINIKLNISDLSSRHNNSNNLIFV